MIAPSSVSLDALTMQVCIGYKFIFSGLFSFEVIEVSKLRFELMGEEGEDP